MMSRILTLLLVAWIVFCSACGLGHWYGSNCVQYTSTEHSWLAESCPALYDRGVETGLDVVLMNHCSYLLDN